MKKISTVSLGAITLLALLGGETTEIRATEKEVYFTTGVVSSIEIIR